MRLIWDEAKRRANISKHGLDFSAVSEVLDSRFRLDIAVRRAGEDRVLSISYAMGFLAVLSVVHARRDDTLRVISFRRSREEREVYDEWLQNECDEA